MKRFSLTTLGCKVNQYDGCAIAAALRHAGLEAVPPGQPADLVAINTCCVTAGAMRKSRQAIRRALRSSPGAAVLVLGCYSDYDGRRIGEILSSMRIPPDRTAIAGHHDDLAECLEGFSRRLQSEAARQTPAQRCRPDRPAASPGTIKARRKAALERGAPGTRRLGAIDRFAGHQRAFVKVQDGCDAFCAYCVVPYTRCRVWSRPIDEVERECRGLVAAGHKEIVLSGVFLGAFGRDTAVRRRWTGPASSQLPDLLSRIAGIEGVWRVRLSSLEPGDVTDELLAACRLLPNVAPHFHLPLQSGSEPILRRMNRQYTPEQYRRTADRLRSALDRPAITTDVMVGFPGETEKDFAATLAAARHAGFAKIHAFPFSAVEGTAAWGYRHEAAPPGIVKARMAQLADLERDLAASFRRQFVGEALEALVEAPRGRPAAVRQAMTDRYVTVRFRQGPQQPPDELTGRIVRLDINEVTDDGLNGELVEAV